MAGKFEFCQIIECCENTWMRLKKFCLGLELFLMALTWTSYNKILFWPKSPPSECVCLKWARIWIAPKIYLRCPEKKNGQVSYLFQNHTSWASEASYDFSTFFAFSLNWLKLRIIKTSVEKGPENSIFFPFSNSFQFFLNCNTFKSVVHRCSKVFLVR